MVAAGSGGRSGDGNIGGKGVGGSGWDRESNWFRHDCYDYDLIYSNGNSRGVGKATIPKQHPITPEAEPHGRHSGQVPPTEKFIKIW
ncbi:hypothetical protein Tco_1011994 [Tanacetum coccineum]